MATPVYSELELAINTLVTQFQAASADHGETLTVEEFQGLVSKDLPTMVKTEGEQDGLNELLKQMGVEDGQGVSFENFWELVNSLATQQFGLLHKDKTAKCKCLLL
ncbi:protein S100-A13-like [Astyanax mexicanus]|uniref:Protein S100-A13-like n=2 Tax=Astyanax mexicanus TaxID=7994 RepID=A0A8B9KUD1_ASTMX|nr:protein S100-A13-like [Astyanax mexicanus]